MSFIINPYSFGLPDTTSDGKQAFLFIGDSTSSGVSNNSVTTVDNTVYSSDGSSITELATGPQFGVTYNALTGYKPVIIARGVSGATIYPNGNNNNWFTSGDNYAPAAAVANNTLSLLGISRLKGIIINLGINDVNGVQTFVNITTGLNSLISRLQADFPNTPIVVFQIGRNAAGMSARIASMRNLWRQTVIDNTNVHFCGGYASLVAPGSLYDADGIHLTPTGNGEAGKMAARWFFNSSYNKWARAVISAQFDELSSARKTLINDFFATASALAGYLELDSFYNFKTTTKNNCFVDWAFLVGPLADNGFSFTSNSRISTNGSSTYFRTGFNPTLGPFKSSQNNVFTEMRWNAAQTSGEYLCGSVPVFSGDIRGNGILNRGAAGADVFNYCLNSTKVSALHSGALVIAGGRSASNAQAVLLNGVVAASNSGASTTPDNIEEFIGCLSINGTAGQFAASTPMRWIKGKYTTISDFAAFTTALNTLQDNW